jgi:hypothetical protein
MKIVLLAPPNVEEYYTASLLLRGFKAVTIPASVPSLDFPKLMRDYLKHDGCLLISDDPNSVEIADNFERQASQFGAALLRSQGLLAELSDDWSHERNRRLAPCRPPPHLGTSAGPRHRCVAGSR